MHFILSILFAFGQQPVQENPRHLATELARQDGTQVVVANGEVGWGQTPLVTGLGEGGRIEVEWKHDPDGAGPLHPITVRSAYKPQPGESHAASARNAYQQTRALMDVFPPNCGPEVPTGG